MRTYDLSSLDDAILIRDLDVLIGRERSDLATVLAHIAEVDARRLYLHAGFPSMYTYCLGRLRLSEQSAMKRIRAGRVARRIPGVFAAVADGRVHLSAVVLLAPHLHPGNVDELLREAEGKSMFEIERALSRLFPRPDVPADIQAIEPLLTAAAIQPDTLDGPGAGCAGASGPMVTAAQPKRLARSSNEVTGSQTVQPDETELSSRTVEFGGDSARGGMMARAEPVGVGDPRVGAASARSDEAGDTRAGTATGCDYSAVARNTGRVMPLAPERFAVQFTIGKETFDDLRDVQNLLSHSVRKGDIAQVFALSLKALKRRLEQRKFGATDRPRSPSQAPNRRPLAAVSSQAPARRTLLAPSRPGSRAIPAHVRRAVWERDRGQCTFVSESGGRCAAREYLEYDHVQPVARGGQATVDGIRLRCRGHNQLEADRAFGVSFMERKREEARRARSGKDRDDEPPSCTAAHASATGVIPGSGPDDEPPSMPRSQPESPRPVRSPAETNCP